MNKMTRNGMALSFAASALVLAACGSGEAGYGTNTPTTTYVDTHQEPSIGEPGGPSKPSGPDPKPMFVFDALGVAPLTVYTYAGTGEEYTGHPNGEYPSGEEHAAECGTTGRVITSQTKPPKSSDKWVKIDVPGGDTYASRTYGRLEINDPQRNLDFSQLPPCLTTPMPTN